MQFTASQIAALCGGGTVEGSADVKLSNFAKIEEAREGDLTFLANERYTPYLYTTEASAVLVGRDHRTERPVGATLIRVDDPYAALASLMRMVEQALHPRRTGRQEPVSIDPTARVGEDCWIGAFAWIGANAVIGRGVQIYPHAFIGDNAVIGDDTIIYPHVTVYHDCRIGSGCIIHAGAVVGSDGFGFAPVEDRYEKLPQMGNVVVGDNVELGANTTIDRATMGSTVIEDGVKLDNLVHIAHNVRVGANTVAAAQVGVAGSTRIGRHVMLGGQVGVAGHISVGDNVMLAAQSGVHTSITPGRRMIGSPPMDLTEFGRIRVLTRRLPRMAEEIENLRKQIAQLLEQQNNNN